MQTTAIGTVAKSLPQNVVILLTLLIPKRYIPYTDLRKKAVITHKNFHYRPFAVRLGRLISYNQLAAGDKVFSHPHKLQHLFSFPVRYSSMPSGWLGFPVYSSKFRETEISAWHPDGYNRQVVCKSEVFISDACQGISPWHGRSRTCSLHYRIRVLHFPLPCIPLPHLVSSRLLPSGQIRLC